MGAWHQQSLLPELPKTSNEGDFWKLLGGHLRKMRVARRYSLQKVADLASRAGRSMPKYRLSRIEAGAAKVDVLGLTTLAIAYGVRVTELLERFQLYADEIAGGDVEALGMPGEVVLRRAREHVRLGDYFKALCLLTTVADPTSRFSCDATTTHAVLQDIELEIINCLMHLQYHDLAKARCEVLLNRRDASPDHRFVVLYLHASCCIKTRLFGVAELSMREAQALFQSDGVSPGRQADFLAMRGTFHSLCGDDELALRDYSEAARHYEQLGNHIQSCRATINLVQVLIDLEKIATAGGRLREALQTAQAMGHDRLTALALSHFVVIFYNSSEWPQAEEYAAHSNSIAEPLHYYDVLFRNVFYCRKIAEKRKNQALVALCTKKLGRYVLRAAADLPEVREFIDGQCEETTP